MYHCDHPDCCVLRHHSQWSDNHVASTSENVLAEREKRYCGELEVLTIAAVRTNREVQGLPVVAKDPGDEQAQEAASSSNRPVWPMSEPQPEQQENRGDRELLRETDGDTPRSRQKQWQRRLEASQSCRLCRSASGMGCAALRLESHSIHHLGR